MSLESAVGRVYGPSRLTVEPARVAAYAGATGDDPARWSDHAPPGFASLLLFQAAPAFLGDAGVRPFTRSLIHSEQSFDYSGPLPIGSEVMITGSVTGVRARGALNLVTFEVEFSPWVTGRSVFLMSDEAAATADERAEPAHSAKATDQPPPQQPWPEETGDLPGSLRSASRADLVRYAAATADFNPIHWDHDAARGAGLSGVVCHGLLMAAWMMQAASSVSSSSSPMSSFRIRFRQPLLPADQACVEAVVKSVDGESCEVATTITSRATTLATATALVTR